MQSSAGVAGRALIMLLCVVGIPIVALSDVSWSDMLKKLEDFPWPTVVKDSLGSWSSSDAPAQSDAPPFVHFDAPKTTPDSPRTLEDVPAATPAKPVQSSILPVSFQSPVGSAPEASACIASQDTPENLTRLSDLGTDPFRGIQERLKSLGATYYLLESWGTQRQTYRFYCKTAIGGSSDYTRCFEATHADPVQAMLQVLHKVEAQKADIAVH